MLIDEVAISCIANVIAALIQRTPSDIEESRELLIRASTKSFSDICGR